jgi:hypothetical protein
MAPCVGYRDRRVKDDMRGAGGRQQPLEVVVVDE